MIMNLIIGNCAGTFSTITNYLSWMCIESIKENNISLNFHWANKTDFYGNTFYWYNKVKSYDVNQSLLDRPNFLNNFFKIEKNNLPKEFEEYVESSPIISNDIIPIIPEFLNIGSKGSSVELYSHNIFPYIRKKFNLEWEKLSLSDNLKLKLCEELKIIEGKKVLTLMLRCSAHYLEMGGFEQLKNDLINEIEVKLNDYDKILIITQVQEIFDILTETFGDVCIFPERKRISGDVDWKGGRGICMSNEEYLKEVEECIIDVFMASQTSHIMSGASNMFLGSLIINPDITFNLFDSLKKFNGA